MDRGPGKRFDADRGHSREDLRVLSSGWRYHRLIDQLVVLEEVTQFKTAAGDNTRSDYPDQGTLYP